MIEWIKLFPDRDLQEGERKLVQVAARRVIVLRFKGKLYALESNCPHMRYSLMEARITDDGGIICPFHHSAFDLTTGDVKEWSPWPPIFGPIVGKIVRERVLVTFPVRVKDDFVWVLPEPQNV